MLSDERFMDLQAEFRQTLKRTNTYALPDTNPPPMAAPNHRAGGTVMETMKACAASLGVNLNMLLGDNRQSDLMRKRRIFYLAMREKFPFLSQSCLASKINRDQTTLAVGLHKARRYLQHGHHNYDPDFVAEYERVLRELG